MRPKKGNMTVELWIVCLRSFSVCLLRLWCSNNMALRESITEFPLVDKLKLSLRNADTICQQTANIGSYIGPPYMGQALKKNDKWRIIVLRIHAVHQVSAVW